MNTVPIAKPLLDRFSWERAITGPNGPASSTTRLVLLVVAMHVGWGRTCAWPNIATLVRKTALSNRSVIDHLKCAINDGWLVREKTKLKGMTRRGTVYHIRL